mmetsp:Transcript_4063/g.13576  ORF Transcript_4063/g.13576 Transcript_4063/m.13576 type:complete len:106 (-) Transcript_4063:34-351(-)
MLMTTHKKTPLSILYTHTKMNAPLRIEFRVRKALSILNGTTSEIPFVLGYKKTPPVDRVIDGQSFVRGFSGFQFRRIRGAAISMTTLTARAAPTASSWLMDFARP